MIATERRNLILQEAYKNKSVLVQELAERFEVSDETIRRDLEKLEEEGFLKKGYGGAVLNEDIGMELPFNLRSKINPEGKQKIAEIVVSELQSGDHIFLDASSTTVFISRAIKRNPPQRLTVITNSIENAVSLADTPGVEVILIGGILSTDSMALMGVKALETIASYHLDKAFLSCSGFDIERGVSDGSDEIVSIKQAVMDVSDMVCLAVDSDKFGRVSFSKLCPISDINMVITEKEPATEWMELLGAMNIKVLF
jgi:DeoR/GlpR family transcriptional regulator of sugar metabolism